MTETAPIDSAETIDATTVELVPVRNRSLFHTSDPEEVLAAAKRVASALKQELDAARMVQTIGGRPGYVRAEGWQTLAAMLGLTVRIAWTRALEDGSGFIARAEVVANDGRVIGAAEGMCSSSERNWATRDSFAQLSMTQTRATTKALRTVLAFVMTLSGHEATPAEEMDVVAGEPEPASMPAWAKPADVQGVAQMLIKLLAAAGVPDPAKLASGLGQAIFDRCDKTVPVCVHAALEDVYEVIALARPQTQEADH
jgi:hypothetical protein